MTHGSIPPSWHRPTLTPAGALPSALKGLTAVFGMGTGGPPLLEAPGGKNRKYREQFLLAVYVP